MNLNIFLACAVIILSLDQTISEQSDTNPSPPLQISIISLIDALTTAGKTPVKLGKTVIHGAVVMTNAVLDTTVKAGSELLNGSVQTFKHGVDSTSNLIKIVRLPGLDPVVYTGNKAINLAADLKNLAGQGILQATCSIGKIATDSIEKVGNAGANVVEGGMEIAANIAKHGVKTGVKLVEGAAGGLQYVDKGLDALSSLVKTVGDRIKLKK